jgi:hypothetical protein
VASLDDFIENVAILVDSTPEPAFPSTDRHDHLVQMSDLIRVRGFAPQAAGIVRAELLRPTPDRFIGNNDAALQQHFLHEAKAQWKSEIQPDRVDDHRRRNAMAFVVDWALGHFDEIAAILPAAVKLTSPVERLMRTNALRARPRRRGLPNDGGERSVIMPKILDGQFAADRPNQKWVADVTYLLTAEGWLYVAAVIDLFSRRIVGCSMNVNQFGILPPIGVQYWL